MILPTNDGFVAADSILIRGGTQELYAIDAGTEANDEQVTGGGAPNTPGIPADPAIRPTREPPESHQHPLKAKLTDIRVFPVARVLP